MRYSWHFRVPVWIVILGIPPFVIFGLNWFFLIEMIVVLLTVPPLVFLDASLSAKKTAQEEIAKLKQSGLGQCKTCQNWISQNAENCPKCGEPNPVPEA